MKVTGYSSQIMQMTWPRPKQYVEIVKSNFRVWNSILMLLAWLVASRITRDLLEYGEK